MQMHSVKKSYREDSHHSRTPAATVAHAIARMAQSQLDIFSELNNITGLGAASIPIYHAATRSASNQWGKGLTHEQSRASALMERIERYSAVHAIERRRQDLPMCSRRALPGRSLGIEELTACNVQHFLYKDLRTIDHHDVVWEKAYSLTHHEHVWLPASRVYLAFRQPHIEDFTCSNGLSANNTMEEAVAQGLCELVERHVYHLHYLNRQQESIPRIQLRNLKNSYLARAVSDLTADGFIVIANYHKTDLPFCTVSVLLFKPDHPHRFRNAGCHVHFATASDPEIALIRCITECIQSMAAETFLEKHEVVNPGGVPPLVKSELAWRLAQNASLDVGDIPHRDADDFKDDIDTAVDTLRTLGHEVLVADLTHEKIDIPVVRVICPGLQPNFLLLGRSIDFYKSAVSSYIDGHQSIWEKARKGPGEKAGITTDGPLPSRTSSKGMAR